MTKRADGTLPSRRDILAAGAALGASSLVAPHALAQATPKRGGHLIVGCSGASSSDSLDAALAVSSYPLLLSKQVYDTLTFVNEKIDIEPNLAESWEMKPGAAEWHFKLRRGVAFHNGKDVTAADVVYSINHHRDKNARSIARALVEQIADVKAAGKYDVVITLSSGNVELPSLVSLRYLGIVPEGDSFATGMGTGPYKLDSFEPGVAAKLTRNPNYWDSRFGHVDSIDILAINDPSARVNAVLSGSVHLADRISPTIVGALQKNAATQVFTVSGGGLDSFQMFCNVPPYDNIDLRLAMKYAIDREAIVKTVLRGLGKVGNDHPIPSYDPMFAADLPQRRYDPDRARFHFKKSGHNAPLELTVSDVAFNAAVEITQLYREAAAKAGIEIAINRVPSDGYWSGQTSSKWPFMADTQAGRPTTDIVLATFYASDAKLNNSHWRKPEFDTLLAAARVEADIAKRKALYRDMQLMIRDEAGSVIPVFTNYIDAGSRKLRGFTPSPISTMSGYRAPSEVWFA